MNIAKAAEVLGVTKQTVRNLLKRGDLQGKQNGRDWDVDAVSVEALRLHRQKQEEKRERKKQRREAGSEQGNDGNGSGQREGSNNGGGIIGWLKRPVRGV